MNKEIKPSIFIAMPCYDSVKISTMLSIFQLIPLGAFINHSNTPNCEKIELHADGEEPFKKKWNLITRQKIKKGEEITLRYTFYNV